MTNVVGESATRGGVSGRKGVENERSAVLAGAESAPRDLILNGAGRSGVSGGYSRFEDNVERVRMEADLVVEGAFPALLETRDGGFPVVHGERGRNGEDD